MASFRESEQAIHDAAREQVGFDDFGDDAYLEGLRVLLASIDESDALSDMGRMLLRRQVVTEALSRLVPDAIDAASAVHQPDQRVRRGREAPAPVPRPAPRRSSCR